MPKPLPDPNDVSQLALAIRSDADSYAQRIQAAARSLMCGETPEVWEPIARTRLSILARTVGFRPRRPTAVVRAAAAAAESAGVDELLDCTRAAYTGAVCTLHIRRWADPRLGTHYVSGQLQIPVGVRDMPSGSVLGLDGLVLIGLPLIPGDTDVISGAAFAALRKVGIPAYPHRRFNYSDYGFARRAQQYTGLSRFSY